MLINNKYKSKKSKIKLKTLYSYIHILDSKFSVDGNFSKLNFIT